MKLRLLPAAVMASLALIFIVGCGGGDDGGETTAAPVETTTTATALTKAELIAQGDAICAEVNAAVGTISSTTATDSSSQTGQEADLYGGMVERLKALGEPSDDSTGYAEFISAAEELAQAEGNASLAAERDDEEALSSAEAEVSSALSSFQSAASSFGFEKCAEAPSAPTPTGGIAEEATEEPAEVVEEEIVPEEAEPAPEETGGAEEEGGGVGGEGGAEEGTGGSAGGIGPG